MSISFTLYIWNMMGIEYNPPSAPSPINIFPTQENKFFRYSKFAAMSDAWQFLYKINRLSECLYVYVNFYRIKSL